MFLFSGGGTGGHLFPGIAVAQELKRRFPSAEIVFVGSERAIESSIVAESGFEHQTLPVQPLSILRTNPIRFLWRNVQACLAASRLLHQLRPTAVIGLGGFASAPVVWAASRQKIPVILLEQNVIAGRATRWLSRYASTVCLSFDETGSQIKCRGKVVVTGTPVRTQISDLHSFDVIQSSPRTTEQGKRQLLVLGGSQGADSLNDAVLAAVTELRSLFDGWEIVHQTGPRQVTAVRQAYENLGISAVVEPFFSDMPARYAAASIVISRAGATTLAELACVGVPMILVPFPHAADNHQAANAQVFVDRGAATLIAHQESIEQTGQQLAAALQQLMADTDLCERMGRACCQLARPTATDKVANLICERR